MFIGIYLGFQVSVYRTIGPLVFMKTFRNFELLMNINVTKFSRHKLVEAMYMYYLGSKNKDTDLCACFHERIFTFF